MNRKILGVILFISNFSVFSNELNNSVLNMEPANIINVTNHKKSLINQIEFPEGKDDVKVFLRCETVIEKNGHFFKSYCYDINDEFHGYIDELYSGMMKSTAIPALINGEKMKVWVTFSILFKRKGGKEKITILPNHLNNVSEYGYHYTAPQRYEKRGRSKCASTLNKPTLFIQSISKTGIVEEVKHQEARCGSATAKTFEDALYIPAKVNGAFVSGIVKEYIFPKRRIIYN